MQELDNQTESVDQHPDEPVDTTVEQPKPEHRTVNDRPTTLEESIAQYHVGNGLYSLPNGDQVKGKRQAMAVLKSYWDAAEQDREEAGDEGVTYVCLQHPEMIVFTPAGQIRFENGRYTTDNPEVIETLDNTPYVTKLEG